jgi:natural product precursor
MGTKKITRILARKMAHKGGSELSEEDLKNVVGGARVTYGTASYSGQPYRRDDCIGD